MYNLLNQNYNTVKNNEDDVVTKQILVFKDNSTVFLDLQVANLRKAPTQGIVINIDEWNMILEQLDEFDAHFKNTSYIQ